MSEGNMNAKTTLALSMVLLALTVQTVGQNSQTATAESVRGHFTSINHKVLVMAKDFPEDKYDFKLRPEMRTFHDLIIHIAGGNIYAAKAGRGENVDWTDVDPKNYKTKAEVVAMFEKSMNDADATLKSLRNESFSNSVDPWLDVTEHSAEHYGLLVAYYRANGLVPPESRPK
jgi:DinB superfamily